MAGLVPGAPIAIDDVIYGGDGLDYLYGGLGKDVFVFESASAFNDVDRIYDYTYANGDAIDISDLLTNWIDGHPIQGDINNYLQLTEVGNDTIVSVDANGGERRRELS